MAHRTMETRRFRPSCTPNSAPGGPGGIAAALPEAAQHGSRGSDAHVKRPGETRVPFSPVSGPAGPVASAGDRRQATGEAGAVSDQGPNGDAYHTSKGHN
jgi:hypothetical protein